MRRSMLVFAVFIGTITLFGSAGPSAASPSVPAAAAVTTASVQCNSTVNNAPAIEAALDTGHVVLHGWCGVDWAPLPLNPSLYWKGIAVPNNRVLTIAADAIVFLRPDQAIVPYDREHTPHRASVRYADLVTTRDQNPTDITIAGSGVIDGMAADQKDVDPGTGIEGKGYDGIQLQEATNSRVWGVKIRNIRGVNGGGDPEGDNESFAINILESWATPSLPISISGVTITASGSAHRAHSSTGIGTNLGANVTIDRSTVSNLQGSCFTAWWTDNVHRNDNVGDNCDSSAFRNEYGNGGVDTNNWYLNSQYGLALVGESNFVAFGMVIVGNDSFGAVASQGCTAILLHGHVFPSTPDNAVGGDLLNGCLTDQLIRHP